MNPTMRRAMVWMPWVMVAGLAAAYLIAAYWVAQQESEPWIVLAITVGVGVLLFFPLSVAVEVIEEKALSGVMRPGVRRLLYWTPRIAAILFLLFLSLFALDVFDMGLTFWETILALLIHLIPVFVGIAAVAAAWRWEWIGALALIGWAVFYMVMAWGSFGPLVYAQIAGLPFVLGASPPGPLSTCGEGARGLGGKGGEAAKGITRSSRRSGS